MVLLIRAAGVRQAIIIFLFFGNGHFEAKVHQKPPLCTCLCVCGCVWVCVCVW